MAGLGQVSFRALLGLVGWPAGSLAWGLARFASLCFDRAGRAGVQVGVYLMAIRMKDAGAGPAGAGHGHWPLPGAAGALLPRGWHSRETDKRQADLGVEKREVSA